MSVRAVSRETDGDLLASTDWASIFQGARAVVHMATRAAAPKNKPAWIGEETESAAVIARIARRAGVERVIFVSSIRAMGADSGKMPFRADTPPQPVDEYGRGKLAVEHAIQEAPSLVILRPPLVYGPGSKGNVYALLAAIHRGLPLPFGLVRNERSFIFIENLLDLIETSLDTARTPPGVYLMRDDDDVAMPELLRRMGRGIGRKPLLLPFPPFILDATLRLLKRRNEANALFRSLRVDDSATRSATGWKPRVSMEDGLAITGQWFQATRR